MKIYKAFISCSLLLVAVFYSIDMHGLSHVIDDGHSDDSNHCELCIINHQKDQTFFALEPNLDFFELPLKINTADANSNITSVEPSIPSPYFLGQFFNRPPPHTL